MSLKETVYSVLVVSPSKNFNETIAGLLPAARYQPVHFVPHVNSAKRTLAARDFDFIIINGTPSMDVCTRFAIDCCQTKAAVVLLLVKSELYGEVHDKVSAYGVFTLPKPTSRSSILQALDFMAAARQRLHALEKKTFSMEDKMEEIRTVNRAKCLLISHRAMTEQQAHRYIERHAMDTCTTKRQVAETIISELG